MAIVSVKMRTKYARDLVQTEPNPKHHEKSGILRIKLGILCLIAGPDY